MALQLSNLSISVGDTSIVSGVSLELNPRELHVLMGPNGSGKSTLAQTVMGHPEYTLTNGRITLDGRDITAEDPDERAKQGLFLSFQYPSEIAGVSVQQFLRTSYNAVHDTEVDVLHFHKTLKEEMKRLGLPEDFAKRSVNEGFSGGEKKRMEMLQLVILKPKYAILDETDSGLDVDAIKLVAKTIQRMQEEQTGLLVITHYNRLLLHLSPDNVHVMRKGKLIQSGTKELVETIEREGYDSLISQA